MLQLGHEYWTHWRNFFGRWSLCWSPDWAITLIPAWTWHTQISAGKCCDMAELLRTARNNLSKDPLRETIPLKERLSIARGTAQTSVSPQPGEFSHDLTWVRERKIPTYFRLILSLFWPMQSTNRQILKWCKSLKLHWHQGKIFNRWEGCCTSEKAAYEPLFSPNNEDRYKKYEKCEQYNHRPFTHFSCQQNHCGKSKI